MLLFANYLGIAFCLASAVNSAGVADVDRITDPDCGRRPLAKGGNTLIVGGDEAQPNSWPFICSLQKKSPAAGNYHICGGSLVRSRAGVFFFLTAAHCVASGSASSYSVRCAAHDKYQYEPQAQTLEVTRVVPHPDYDPNTVENDLAVLSLDTQPTQNDVLQPVCLADKNYASGEMVTVIGWGTLSSGGPSPSKLQEATKPVISRRECNRDSAYGGAITRSMLCAGYVGTGGVDACQGDSGGPLVAERNGKWTLIGVVSWGWGCAHPNYPGVYADVNYLSSWIDATINA